MLNKLIQKSVFPATKYIMTTTLRVQPVVYRPMLLKYKGSIHTSSKQLFASDWQQAPVPNHPIIEKLQQHPHIMQQLIDFTSLLQSKGVDVSGKQPSFMQVMKIMNDPEVKEKVKVLAQDMQAAGIQLDMQTIQELQASMTQQPNFTNENSNQEDKKEGGVMNKVKGLFKK